MPLPGAAGSVHVRVHVHVHVCVRTCVCLYPAHVCLRVCAHVCENKRQEKIGRVVGGESQPLVGCVTLAKLLYLCLSTVPCSKTGIIIVCASRDCLRIGEIAHVKPVNKSMLAVIMILMPLCPGVLPGACVTLAAQRVCLQPGERGALLFCLFC